MQREADTLYIDRSPMRSEEREPLVTRHAEVMGGTPVFARTRVPVMTLVDYLAAGETLDIFLDDFPTVSREQATRWLTEGFEHMLAVINARVD